MNHLRGNIIGLDKFMNEPDLNVDYTLGLNLLALEDPAYLVEEDLFKQILEAEGVDQDQVKLLCEYSLIF